MIDIKGCGRLIVISFAIVPILPFLLNYLKFWLLIFSGVRMVDISDLSAVTRFSGCPQVVWCFWWQGAMNENRLQSLEMMRKNLGVPVVLVGADNIGEYLVEGAPLHPAFSYLSDVHKSDYIRIYFLHHYGGGWHDIKPTGTSYFDAWDVFADPDVYFLGKPEIEGGAAQVYDSQGNYMPSVWKDLVATNRWVGRAYTPMSYSLYESINAVLDAHLNKLSKYPARKAYSHVNDKYNSKWYRKLLGSQYPLQWTLFGDVFHPLNYKFRNNVSRALPFDVVENMGLAYR
ncbi:MAG: capsular polysaccharide synthesis protein [Halopseudomonas sp.]|uniref:capsular polysaccharide synthesis protein n=1 Tax=Halopseudomonas sp. TaxID=2901191 RepID=UPI003001EE5F